ncbi:MAG: hypothetical protein RPT25_13965 [Cycloclasticus sp.]|jgi:hypothetical protein
MSDYKYPADGYADSSSQLNSDIEIMFPEALMDDGFNRVFEVKLVNVGSIDSGVKFAFYGGLDVDVLDASNIEEAIDSIELLNITQTYAKLVYQRNISSTLDTAFKIVITGTNASSSATYIIRARSE